MGDVIQVSFGTEREWEVTREKTIVSLVAVGALFGDDEKLMRAKAESVYRILRRIVEETPSVQVITKMPDNLTPQQVEIVKDAVKDAALKGIEAAMTHSVQALMESIYDLCTSKLRASEG